MRRLELPDASEAPARQGLRLWLSRLEGPQTMGRGPGFWVAAALAVAAAAAYPAFANDYVVGNAAYFLVWTFMAMGLGVVWGYGGALSFGQTAFFGLAGYTYGVITINIGSAFGATWLALLLSVALGGIFALLIGYFMFYGRIKGVFIGIVTLSVTLVLETFMAQTAGPQWRIGEARLNGFNGMSGMPPLTVPWFGGDVLLYAGTTLYYVLLGMVVLVYMGLRMLLNAPFGNVLVAIRENPERAEMLGYDIRLYQMLAFGLGGALAGTSGVLYTAWGQYITPSSMGLTSAALPIVWVAVGGRRDITATLLGCLLVIAGFQSLTIYGSQYALIVMGVLLVFTVLVTPNGLIYTAMDRVGRLFGEARR
ncbi:ABC transporter permease subunit [Meridianimarinicoccus sp. RP-17]|uniref:ABC transporter permease subunit n=1 Tax=Meridianimarinicoccus zhengii TaxID=2056810 RepID=UPI000DABC2DE|nr:ABC transporter permease [Phycocomes zhengii]